METNDLHVHEFQESIVLPTCKENGYTLYKCHCGYERKGNFKPVGDHVYEVVESTPATCTQPGSLRMVCKTCGDSKYQDLQPIGHEFGQWTVQDYPTCTQPGSQIRQCRRCDAREKGLIPPVGHRCAPGTERRTPSGVKYFCENCGQLFHYAPQTLEEKRGTIRFWPTRILMILTMLVTGYYIYWLQKADVKVEWPIYAFLGATILGTGILIIKLDGIRSGKGYTRWVGGAFLIFAAYYAYSVFMLLDNTKDDLLYRYRDMSNILKQVFFCALLIVVATMHFRGEKKQGWLFAAMLVPTILFWMEYLGLASYYGYIMSEFRYITQKECWQAIAINSVPVLIWTELLMLILPPKRSRSANE